MNRYNTEEWMKGYVIAPCFTCRINPKDINEIEMTCSRPLMALFVAFFMPFWKGTVKVTKEELDRFR